MKIVVGIDGEHYTDLYYGFVETEDEAYEWAKEDAKDLECFEFEREEHNRFAGYYWYDPSYDSIPDFTIYECYDLNEKPYILVWWHAYNGVDFELKSVCHYGENIREEFDNQINKLNEVYKFDDVNTEQGLFVGDDGTEWHCLQLIRV